MYRLLSIAFLIGLMSGFPAMAQAPAAASGPQWKDQAEYDLFKQITSEQAPAKRLPLIDSWKEKYPETAFKQQRLLIYLTTYPYECAEQISSRVLAIAALRDVLAAFDAKGLPPADQLVAQVNRDVERLRDCSERL